MLRPWSLDTKDWALVSPISPASLQSSFQVSIQLFAKQVCLWASCRKQDFHRQQSAITCPWMQRHDTLRIPKLPSRHFPQVTCHRVMLLAHPLAFPSKVWTSWKQSFTFNHVVEQQWRSQSLCASLGVRHGAFYSKCSRPFCSWCGFCLCIPKTDGGMCMLFTWEKEA